jgi:hypothetical protein
MTGFGFIVMLAKGLGLQLKGLSVVEASPVSLSCPALLHEGCERFLLEEGISPFSKRARVVFFPYPEATLKPCLEMLDEVRQQSHKLYVPRVPSGFAVNCSRQLDDHDYGDSPRRLCIGMDAADVFVKEQDSLNQGALSREILHMLVKEKKRPNLSPLFNYSGREAADFISTYSATRFEELQIADVRCDDEEVSLEVSQVLFEHRRACFLRKALIDFLWSVHREGFEISIKKNFEKLRSHSQDLMPWAKGLVVQYLALFRELQEFSGRLDVREYAVVLLDRCLVKPTSCKPEMEELFYPVRKKVSLFPNSSLLVLDPAFE